MSAPPIPPAAPPATYAPLADAAAVSRALADPARLETVLAVGALAPGGDPEIDRFTRLAAELVGAPVAAVSLLDAERHHLRSAVGAAEHLGVERSLPITHSVCRYTVAGAAPVVVGDVRAHPVLGGEPAAHELGVGAIVSVPLTARGHVVGTLCAVDAAPRGWTERDVRVLADLAAAVSTEIELRREVAERRRAADEAEAGRALLSAVIEGIAEPVYVKDLEGRYRFINAAGAAVLGRAPHEVVGARDAELFPADYAARITARDREVMAGPGPETYEESGTVGGRPVTFLNTKAPHRDHTGAVVGLLGISREISAAKAAEAALAESEARYRMMFERSPLPMWVFDCETLGFLAVNDAAVAQYGWSRDEFLAMTIRDIRDPDRVPELLSALSEPSSGLRPTGEYHHRRKDGTEVVVGLASHDLTWNGRRARLVLANDITERYAAEVALRESEERLRSVSASSPVGVFMADREGRVTYVNPRCCQIWRATEAELLGSGWRVGVHPDDAAVIAEWAAAQAAGAEFDREFRLRGRDGDDCWVHGRSAPVRDAAGRPVGIAGTIEDVTERRRAGAERAALADHLRLLLESAREGVYGVDASGRVTFVNRAAAAMLARAPEEFIGHDSHATVHHTRADGTPNPVEECPIYRTVHGGPGVRVENDLFWRPDGTAFAVDYSVQPITDDAGAARGGAVIIFSDITERRRLEEELRHAQKMEAVGRLAGGVAHDFNNLLTVIRANVEFLSADLAEGTQARADADEVRRAADRATALTRQLLAFSRKQVLQPQLLQPNTVVTGVERLLRRVLGERIALAAHLAPGLGLIRADAGQLEQVLLNLAVNARDAMPDGGTLTLRTEARTTDTPATALGPGCRTSPFGCVVLSVSDTGTGMDEATRAQAFEPFFTTKPPGHGTGLGLATVYGIVRQSGGTVWIDSTPGRGTTVSVCLPTVQLTGLTRAAPAARPAPSSAPAAAAGTVLLVEDEDGVRAVGRRVLAARGYTVIEAGNGAEAIARWREAEAAGRTIDAVVTDVVMPVMGGRELAARLRAERPALPVLFVSGYVEGGMPGVPDAGAAPGAAPGGRTDFLEKPFPSDVLVARLARLLAR